MNIGRGLIVVLVLLIVIAVLVKAVELFQTNVVEADASNFVLEDLAAKYPGADIDIMTITQKYNARGDSYFEVKTKVTVNPDSPCPERSHILYNYPVQNFVQQPQEAITRGCTVCGEGICTIAFPEEAIIASHTISGTGAVHAYIQANPGAKPAVTEQADSWTVRWDSPDAASYYLVSIHRSGTVLGVKSNQKG